MSNKTIGRAVAVAITVTGIVAVAIAVGIIVSSRGGTHTTTAAKVSQCLKDAGWTVTTPPDIGNGVIYPKAYLAASNFGKNIYFAVSADNAGAEQVVGRIEGYGLSLRLTKAQFQRLKTVLQVKNNVTYWPTAKSAVFESCV